jgi:hypothetical protein
MASKKALIARMDGRIVAGTGAGTGTRAAPEGSLEGVVVAASVTKRGLGIHSQALPLFGGIARQNRRRAITPEELRSMEFGHVRRQKQHLSIMGEAALQRLRDSPPSIFETYTSSLRRF